MSAVKRKFENVKSFADSSHALEYLKASNPVADDRCAKLFKDYQKCLSVRILSGTPVICFAKEASQVALKQKGIDKLVEEAREDHKENDSIHMGRR